MKLSAIYSDVPNLFARIEFVEGLNVVLAEIRLPENKRKDTHNLGKSTLAGLIDFTLLKGRSADFFLFKQSSLFESFTFFLEVRVRSNAFVTIRRSAAKHSKVSIKFHSRPQQDFSSLAEAEWDHWEILLKSAKSILDGYFDLTALKPYDYRKQVPYLLRSQANYDNVFKVQNASTRDALWKPYLAHVLGLDAGRVEAVYTSNVTVDAKDQQLKTVRSESQLSEAGQADIEGLLRIKTQELNKRDALVANFNFDAEDSRKTTELVEEIDARSADLNDQRYSLSKRLKNVEYALVDKVINFDVSDVARLFEEANVFFGGQLKKDYEALIRFNEQIGAERRGYLEEERQEIAVELEVLESELAELGQRRSSLLGFLSGSDSLAKYRALSNELVQLKSDIAVLIQKKEALARVKELASEKEAAQARLKDAKKELGEMLSDEIAASDSTFWRVADKFDEIMYDVTDFHALLSVKPNKEGNLDFTADVLNAEDTATSKGRGNTYKKLMCIAFDLSILSAHRSEGFPKFVYHDGALESLDKRKKEKLLETYRKMTDDGVQVIVTTLDSDLPAPTLAGSGIEDREVVLRLHDEGNDGRLFRMSSW